MREHASISGVSSYFDLDPEGQLRTAALFDAHRVDEFSMAIVLILQGNVGPSVPLVERDRGRNKIVEP